MKKLIVVGVLLLSGVGAFASDAVYNQAYTEFYVNNAAGNNLNSGDTTNAAAVLTYAGGTFVRATGVFTVASGNPASDGVVTNRFASIYTTAGATVATFVARVTGADSTTVTVDLTAIAGAATAVSEGAGEATLKFGGAWSGPSGAVIFPADFAIGTLKNYAGNIPRFNIRSGTDYSVTASCTFNKAGPLIYQGYTTSVGDGGRATLFANGNSFVLAAVSGASVRFEDLILTGNATLGTSSGSSFTGGSTVRRCVFHDFRGVGISVNTAGGTCVTECEAYNCNKANTAGQGGFNASVAGVTFIRCISHDNAGSNVSGFVLSNSDSIIDCIADTNGKNGLDISATLGVVVQGCDFYNNTGAGIDMSGASGQVTVANCNFINNGTYGIGASGGLTARNGAIANCGFGSGNQANDSGDIEAGLQGILVSGSVIYAADTTPWNDPANGDFRITLAAAKDAGRGAFTQTAASYAGTVAYNDIGAAHHITPATSGGQIASASGN